MLGYGVADSAQLDILAKALNDYCARHRVVCEQERERIAAMIMCLFRQGVEDSARLSEALDQAG